MSLCDKSVFKSVFEKWQLPLQHFVIAKGMNRMDAADVIQSVFVKLWKNCSKVRVDTLKAYLFTMAKNECIDHFRIQQKTHNIQLDIKVDDNEDGQYLLEMNEFKIRLEASINSMNANSREVFIMSRFDNMTYKEIAESLEISIKAVEKRMHKALAYLDKKNILKKR